MLTEPKNAVTVGSEVPLLDKVELAFRPARSRPRRSRARPQDRCPGAPLDRRGVAPRGHADIPERTEIRKCIITEETIREGRLPLLLTKGDVDKGVDETNYEEWLAERGETA